MEESPDMSEFHELNELRGLLIGVENSAIGLKRRVLRETVEALFNPIVKVSKDKDGEPENTII